jgi:hypothetical protein
MEAIVVAPVPPAVELGLNPSALDRAHRTEKAARLAQLKSELRRLRAEAERLETELYGGAACLR